MEENPTFIYRFLLIKKDFVIFFLSKGGRAPGAYKARFAAWLALLR